VLQLSNSKDSTISHTTSKHAFRCPISVVGKKRVLALMHWPICGASFFSLYYAEMPFLWCFKSQWDFAVILLSYIKIG